MTREEAIKVLENMPIPPMGGYSFNDISDALDMAIEALKGAEINCVHCPRYFETEDETGVHSHCEDLISRAEAIEAIELVDWYHQNSNKDMVSGANDDKHQAWYKADDVYKALEAVPSADRQRGEWIPCTERMPGDGKWAIWCSNDGVIGIARFKEDCYNHFYPNGTSFGLEDAVAWMPLPEPYKGGDDK